MIHINGQRKAFLTQAFFCQVCGTAFDTDEWVQRTVTDFAPRPESDKPLLTVSQYRMHDCPCCHNIVMVKSK